MCHMRAHKQQSDLPMQSLRMNTTVANGWKHMYLQCVSLILSCRVI